MSLSDDPNYAAARRKLLLSYARRVRRQRLTENALVALLAVDVIAVFLFGMFGVLPEAAASMADAGSDYWEVAKSLLDGPAIVILGALVTSGRWLHGRLQDTVRARAEAKAMCILIQRNDPRIQSKLAKIAGAAA